MKAAVYRVSNLAQRHHAVGKVHDIENINVTYVHSCDTKRTREY